MRTPTCIYADSKYSIKRHGGVIKCNAAKVYLAAYSYGEEKMESLFDISDESNAYAPLADRMRPEILDDIIGQDEIQYHLFFSLGRPDVEKRQLHLLLQR